MINTSVIIPIKNEEENISILINELEPVMERLGKPWELICIDDGSTDQSLMVLQQLCLRKPYLRIITFAKNFGQSAAFAAGFEAARGELIITLDGDGQNDPADIPKLTAVIRECDLACGWRINRQDPMQKKLISKLSNWIRSRVCKDGMHDTGCSLKVYRREALAKIKLYRGMHRFLPALFVMEGLRVKEVPVHHRKREAGVTKYNIFNRSLGPLLDLFAVHWMRSRRLQYQIREEITHEKLRE